MTPIQTAVARLLAGNRTHDSYLAGGAALHLSPRGLRYSNDLDYFQDSEERVATAFAADQAHLESHGYGVTLDMNQPGFIRCRVSKQDAVTKVEWAHDTAWRFLPVVEDERVGFRLHAIDLAINKVLALVGRNEPRDFLDTIYVHEVTLPLGALAWAAAGKDPGFTPLSLLELLRRRGAYRPADFGRLRLTEPVDLPKLKARWLAALDAAEIFIRSRPPSEVGCLYYDKARDEFVAPEPDDVRPIALHFGAPGGILPRVVEDPPG